MRESTLRSSSRWRRAHPPDDGITGKAERARCARIEDRMERFQSAAPARERLFGHSSTGSLGDSLSEFYCQASSCAFLRSHGFLTALATADTIPLLSVLAAGAVF